MTFRKTLSGLGAGIGATLTAGIAAAQTMGDARRPRDHRRADARRHGLSSRA